MNNYFISKILKSITLNKWDNPVNFIQQLNNFYTQQDFECINMKFDQNNQKDTIIEIISNECYSIIHKTISSSNPIDISVYDKLIEDITLHFNEQCTKASITTDQSNHHVQKIINFINVRKLNDIMKIRQKEKEIFLIKEKEKKETKEKNIVEFLSNEISDIANSFNLYMASFIIKQDIPSLESLDSFFSVRCHELISNVSSFIRKNMMTHIQKDIKQIQIIIRKNSHSALDLIEKQKYEKKSKIIKILIKLAGIATSLIRFACGCTEMGLAISSVLDIPKFPFKKNDKPNKNNFVFHIGKNFYEANEDDLKIYCKELSSMFGEKGESFYEFFSRNIEIDSMISLPIEFEKRDYVKFLTELNKNE